MCFFSEREIPGWAFAYDCASISCNHLKTVLHFIAWVHGCSNQDMRLVGMAGNALMLLKSGALDQGVAENSFLRSLTI